MGTMDKDPVQLIAQEDAKPSPEETEKDTVWEMMPEAKPVEANIGVLDKEVHGG